jgi:hypothetical protein
MFTNLWTARKNALGLARNLMMITMVVAVGTRFAVITAEDLDPTHVILNEYNPF